MFDFQIVNQETRAILGPHEDGEIFIRGPTVMKGISSFTQIGVKQTNSKTLSNNFKQNEYFIQIAQTSSVM